MENTRKNNTEEVRLQGLLDRYLNRQNADSSLQSQNHLDQDSLTAFVEGNLTEREAKPIVSHLVDCSFCRHVTAELVKLDLSFAEESAQLPEQQNQPSRVSEVLSNLLASIFGTNDGAVFAHQENEEKTENTEKNTEEK